MGAAIDYSAGDYSAKDFHHKDFNKNMRPGFLVCGIKRCPETGLLKAGLHPGLPHLLVRFNGGCLYWYRSRHYDAGRGRFGQADKWNMSVMNPVEYHIYRYVRNNSIRYVDPLGFDTKVIITYTYLFKQKFAIGRHAALYVDYGDSKKEQDKIIPIKSPLLYDPNGAAYTPNINPLTGAATRSSGDTFYNEQANLEKFYQSHFNAGSSFIKEYTFKTTPEQELELANKINDSASAGTLGCSTSVSEALGGIGPFKNLKSSFWPKNLDKDLGKIPDNIEKTIKSNCK